MSKQSFLCATMMCMLAVNYAPAQIILTDDFSDGDRTNNPAWYTSSGSLSINNGSAFNDNSTLNQFFTTSFASTELGDGAGLRLSLDYRPDGANLNGLRIGIFSGAAPAADSWAQFTAGQPTRDWRGYYAEVGLTNESVSRIVFNDNAVDDHAFFSGTTISSSGQGTNVAGILSFRSVMFEISRQGDDMLINIYEGADADSRVLLSSATHPSAPMAAYNNLSMFYTTGNAANGAIRYDNIVLESYSNAPVTPAQIVLSDNFSDGDRTANPAWFISSGSMAINNGAAFNNSSTLNQFFTTSFANTNLSDQAGLRLSFEYRPDGANLNGLRLGIFSGVAPTADSWAQFSAGQPTRDWRGYYAEIGLTNGSTSRIAFNDNDVDDHAFFNGTTISLSGQGTNVAGVLSFRSVRFEITRQGSDMLVEVYEGPDAGSLVLLSSATHASAPMDGYNNLSMFYTTGNAANGGIRYDNILLESFAVASALSEPDLHIQPGVAGTVLVTLSNLTVSANCTLLAGSSMDPASGMIVTSFVTSASAETIAVPADDPLTLFWSETTAP